MTFLSIIIPVLHEAAVLPRLLRTLQAAADVEILVVDGGSHDGTCEAARSFGVTVLPAARGRARQMNAGAAAARGEWFWFLHADSELPAAWAEQLRDAMCDPRVVGGGFRVQIAAAGLGSRALDAWGRWRTRWQRTFYGDQGIFVRRAIFTQLGGFADIPVLEDLEFSDRLRRAGRVAIVPGPIRTSPRRWQQQGWWRTVLRHSRLVLAYHARRPAACASIDLVIMAKAPLAGQVKTRLTPPLTPLQAAALARALLEDTARAVSDVTEARLIVAVAPAAGVSLVQAMIPQAEVVPQAEGALGDRMAAVMHERFGRGGSAVLVLGSDHPTVPRAAIARAVAWLRDGTDQVVLGPTEDGGYYLMGLTRPHPELFEGIPWSSPAVFRRTVARAEALRLPVRRLACWHDVDTPEDLARLREELAVAPHLAPATAALTANFDCNRTPSLI